MPPRRSPQELEKRVRELELRNLELEETLHLVEEARSYYADHFDFAPFGCLTLDSVGCIREINLAAANLLGRKRFQLIDLPFLTLVERSNVRDFVGHLHRCKRLRERIVTEIAVVCGRSLRLVELSSAPVHDPRIDRTVYRTALFDVTERRRAEQALRQSEERFSKAFRASPNAIAISTLAEARFIDANPSFCRLTGYRHGQLIGRTARELNIERDPSARERLVEELRQTRTIQNLEGRLRARSGATYDVLIFAEIIELGGEECVLMIQQNITDLKRLQREVLEIGEAERQRIGQDLHDDTCQNLTAIALRAEVIGRELARGQPEHAAKIREVARLMKEQADQVRRLASGLFPTNVERYGLAWALQELTAEAGQRSDILCSFQMNQPVEINDPRISIHLYRVAQEALSNAIRHGRPRKIEVELAAQDGAIRLAIRNDGRRFPRKLRPGGLGLQSMRYRASVIGGAVDIRCGAKGGTVVICSVPTTVSSLHP